MATTTALSPDSSPSTTGNKILGFFQSLLIYLFDTLQRALESVSRTRSTTSAPTSAPMSASTLQTHPASTPSSSSNLKQQEEQQYHQNQQRQFSSMTTATTSQPPPPNRMQPPKIIPALPLLPPPRAQSPKKATKDTKENLPTSHENEKHGDQQSQTGRQQGSDRTNLADITDSLSRLDTNDGNDGNGPDGAEFASLAPSTSTSTMASLPVFAPCPSVPIEEPLTGEKAIHSGFMRDALDMARLALVTNETPVGCVLVHNGRVIAKGMNATNITRNGTRHAELMAISALLSFEPQPALKPAPQAPASEARRRKRAKRRALVSKTDSATTDDTTEDTWRDVDPRDGHIFPYGQKFHPSPRVDQSIISECVLYVTVEPCVMCASLLRQLRIKKVYFGAVNDKFGGTGGVFRIHMNAHETVAATMATAPPSPRLSSADEITRPALQPRAATCNGEENGDSAALTSKNPEFQIPQRVVHEQTYLGGHGGNVEPGYEAEGGWGRDEAVTLLRQFYVQENGRAPIPRKKEGRAARLAIMLERDGHAGGPMIQTTPGEDTTAPPSPSTSAAEPNTPLDPAGGRLAHPSFGMDAPDASSTLAV